MFYFLITLLFSPLIYTCMAVRNRNGIRRILVIQTAKIGDLICSAPVLRELRRKYPRAHISVAANPIACVLWENNPNLNEIIPIRNDDYKGLRGKIKLVKILKAKKFDLAVTLLPNVPNTLAAFWALIPLRICIYPLPSGTTFRLSSIFNTHLARHRQGTPVSQAYVELLKYLQIETSDCFPEVYCPIEAEGLVTSFLKKEGLATDSLLIGISPGCANKLKQWGAENFARLAEAILARYPAQIIFIGARAEKDTIAAIQKMISRKTADSAGIFSLGQLPALLKKLSLFIAVDTGIIYMAAACGVPTVNIAGPCEMRERPTGAKSLIVQKRLPCVPCCFTYATQNDCRRGDRRCVTSISPREVLAAVHEQLQAHYRERLKEYPATHEEH